MHLLNATNPQITGEQAEPTLDSIAIIFLWALFTVNPPHNVFGCRSEVTVCVHVLAHISCIYGTLQL